MKLVTTALRREAEPIRGRGAAWNPPNRFDSRVHVEDPAGAPDEGPDPDAWFDEPVEPGGRRELPPTEVLPDASRTLVVRNDSPDIGFDAGINPYRGCEHGCIYCYARPSHEYLGFSAGLDFESRILVKFEAPTLLRRALASPRWQPTTIALSGNTDAYQPLERRLRITRGCLEVLAEFHNPVAIITKNALVARDTDLLAPMARDGAAAANVSITTLDPELQRSLEPRASHPHHRLRAIEHLARAGVPVGVMVAPVIPGLTDHEMPRILQAAADAGATFAAFIVLRLPRAVAPLFEAWLRAHRPDRADKVLNRIRALRGGALNDPRFGSRMRGEGVFADQIAALFETARRRAGLARSGPTLSTEAFRRPPSASSGSQLELF